MPGRSTTIFDMCSREAKNCWSCSKSAYQDSRGLSRIAQRWSAGRGLVVFDRAIDSEARLGEVMNAIQDLHFLLRFDIENCEVAVELIGDLISELKAVLVHGSHMQDVLRDALVDKDDRTIRTSGTSFSERRR